MNRMFGTFLLGAGIVLVLVNFGIWQGETVGSVIRQYWPAALIYFALIGLLSDVRRKSIFSAFWNLIVMAVGTGLLLENMDLLSVSWSGLWVPGALIVFGFYLLFSRAGKRPVRTTIRYAEESETAEFTQVFSEDEKASTTTRINLSKDDVNPQASEPQKNSGSHRPSGAQKPVLERVISGTAGDLRIGGANWKLESTRILQRAGSIRLDLRDTFIPEGETVLDIECKAGDIHVFLPDGLEVMVESSVRLGTNRVLDQRSSNGALFYKSSRYEEAERKVRLHIHVKFGDIHVARIG